MNYTETKYSVPQKIGELWSDHDKTETVLKRGYIIISKQAVKLLGLMIDPSLNFMLGITYAKASCGSINLARTNPVI